MSINVEFEQLDRESKVNENIYKADRNFEKVKGALANARHKNDIIPAGDIVFPDNAKFVEVLAEINKKYKEIQDLVRGINVNVQGTVLETQFMKKSVFDKDNDGVVDNAKELNGIVKAVNLSGQVQTASYKKSVIALCDLTNTDNPYRYSFSQGEFYFRRTNGLHPAISIKVNAQKTYNQSKMMINLISFGSDKECAKPCTFNYNNKTYGGIEFYYEPAEHSKIEFTGLTNFEIFGVDYYNTYTKSAINEEIANSINYNNFIYSYSEIFNNQNKIYHSGNQTVALTNRENVFTQKQKFDLDKFPIIQLKNTPNANGIEWRKVNTNTIWGQVGVLSNGSTPIYIYFGLSENSHSVPLLAIYPNGDVKAKGKIYSNNKALATLEYVQQLEQRIQALERKTQNL